MEPHTCKDGRVVRLKSIGRRFVDQILEQHPYPDVPTYTVETVVGETETHPHKVIKDEEGKIIKSTLVTREDQQLWDEYEARVLQVTGERFDHATKFLLYTCIMEDPPPPEEWSITPADLELWGLRIPPQKDKVGYKVFWVENELLTDPEDMTEVLASLYVMAGMVPGDRVSEFEAFFRLTLARLTALATGSPVASFFEDTGLDWGDSDA